MRKIQFAVLLALLVALFLPVTALAKGLPEDKIVFGGTYTLESGEVLDGNLIVFGGSATLEPASQVNGDVVIFGGSLDAQGEITGNVVGIGGLIQLGDTAQVDQDVVTLGANLDRSTNAIVEGEVSSGFTGPFLFDFRGFDFPGLRSVPDIRVQVNPFISLMWIFLRTLLWGALAVVLVLLLPRALDTIGQAAVHQPVISGGVGLLTAILAPLVLLLLVITICLSPLALLGVLILVIAWGLGLIALGLEIGKRLADRMNQNWAPALSAGLGTLLLIFVLNGLREIVPCVGWLFPAIAGMVGLGAVVLTRFGTHVYPLMPPPAPTSQPLNITLAEGPPPSEVSPSLPPEAGEGEPPPTA